MNSDLPEDENKAEADDSQQVDELDRIRRKQSVAAVMSFFQTHPDRRDQVRVYSASEKKWYENTSDNPQLFHPVVDEPLADSKAADAKGKTKKNKKSSQADRKARKERHGRDALQSPSVDATLKSEAIASSE